MFCLALCALLCALCFSVEAQQSTKIPRIGFVGASGTINDPRSNFSVFQQGLRDLGYVDGKNILIEYRNAEGKLDSIPILVDELVQLKIDVLVTTNPIAIRTAKHMTKTIPIVMVSSADPVAMGIVGNLARPGWEYHRGIIARTRSERQKVGATYGSDSGSKSHRNPLGRRQFSSGYRLKRV